jgi:hypothetical protein
MSNGAKLFKGNYRGCAKSPTVGSFASLINAAKSGIVKYGGGDGTAQAGGCCDKTCDNAAGSIAVQTTLPGQGTASKTSSGSGNQTGWISQAPMTYGGGTLGG